MTLMKLKPQRFSAFGDFDRLMSDFLPRQARAEACKEDGCECGWSPRADIVENPNNYQIVVEIPGFEKSDVKLTVEEGILSLSGERKFADESEDRNYRRVERLYGKFERKFRLPKEAELDKIDAELVNGVLTISINKSEKVAGREIQVK